MSGLEGDFRALMVAGGRPHPTLCVAVDGQPLDVEHAAADALVRLAGTTDAEGERVAHELVGIKAADAVAVGDGGQVDEVNEGVNLVQLLALQHAAYELLAGRTIARGVLATSLIYRARSRYRGQFLHALGGQLLAQPLLQLMNVVPQRLAIGAVHHLGIQACTHEHGTHLGYLF